MTGSLSIVQAEPFEGEVFRMDPDCVFCPGNGRVEIIEEHGGLYLVRAKDLATMMDRKDRWLVIPADHITDPDELRTAVALVPMARFSP